MKITNWPLTIIGIILIILGLALDVSADTGGTITTDGAYTIHTFLTNDNYTSTSSKNIEILILGGGGGGGQVAAVSSGGGGAGGLIYNGSYPVTSTTYPIVIGTGGTVVTKGGNTTFNGLIAQGGGNGVGNLGTGANGGSGGGTGQQNSNAAGTGVSGQGNAGNNYGGVNGYSSAGGGGHNTTGFRPTSTADFSQGGSGGTGTNFSISGTTKCYAGGGGGATHEANTTTTGAPGGCDTSGKGAAEGASIHAGNATNGYGGGGGGNARSGFDTASNYGRGGSGVVIIRYLTPSSSAPTISFTTPPTPTNNSVYYQRNTSLTINATISSGNFNITLKLFNSTGGTVYTNNSNNVNSLETIINTNSLNLPIGTYFFNATFLNATYNNLSETRRFYLYDLTSGTITTPANDTTITSTSLNIVWTNTTTNPTGTGVTISSYNVTLLNPNLSFNKTINFTTNGNSYNWNIINDNLDIGLYWLRVETKDSNGNNITTRNLINITTNALLNISLYDAINNTRITANGTLNYTNLGTGITNLANITNGTSNSLTIAKNQNYSFYFDVNGYSIATANRTASNLTNQQMNFTLYTNNSVSIYIYDEDTNLLITQNITVVLTGTSTTNTYTTTTGNLYIDNIADGTYSVSFSNANYTLKTYSITVASRSTQTLNAYLTTSSNTVVFSTVDFDSAASLTGATYTQARQINGTWTVIDTRTSDITGRVQFSYQTNVNYQFTVSLTDYTTEQFYLNPVIFTSYTIRLHKITTLSSINTPQGLNVVITYNPSSFYNNGSIQTFTWTISDATGSLTAYNLSTATPNAVLTSSGTNAYGQQFTHNLNFTGAGLTDTFNVTYCYDTTISSVKCFNYKFLIIGTYTTTSFLANKDNTYGMGILERVLIVTGIIVTIAGLVFFIGGALAGLPVALLLMGYFYYTGFISLWMILPSLFIGIVILLGRQE